MHGSLNDADSGGPFLLTPTHTCTFVGCFGRGLDVGFSPSFLQKYRNIGENLIVYLIYRSIWHHQNYY